MGAASAVGVWARPSVDLVGIGHGDESSVPDFDIVLTFAFCGTAGQHGEDSYVVGLQCAARQCAGREE